VTEQEKTLISGCARGEKAAWDEFVKQYSNLVYHTIRKTLTLHHTESRDEVIEDLYQEFFISILQNNCLWKVDDASTAHLMSSFYRNLKTMTKSEALRQAQMALIRGQGRSDLLARRGVGGIGKLGETPAAKSQSQDSNSVSTSHPYFWAPFILVGDGK
jgi:hypothetical protein